jgi:hypothetical protein
VNPTLNPSGPPFLSVYPSDPASGKSGQ